MTEAVSQWRDYWLTLPDAAFFEAMKTFPLPLPPSSSFNKHKMIDALISFFLREETQNAVVASVDENDAELLSAVALFGALPPQKIYFFFSEKESEESFLFRLMNLEERMLIYRNAKTETLALNPILEPRLRKEVISYRRFFSETDEEFSADAAVPTLSDSLILAAAAFLAAHPKAIKRDGSFRKKTAEKFEKLFRLQDEGGLETGRSLQTVLRFFHQTAVLHEEDDSLRFDAETFVSLGTLPLSDLLFLTAAADERISGFFRPPQTAALLRSLTRETGRLKSCSRGDFTALFYLLSDCSPQTRTQAPLFLDVLTENRLLLSDKNGRFGLNPLIRLDGAAAENRTIIRDDGQILFSPGSNPRSSFYLPIFADIADFNLFPVFQISRESLFRGFDAGLTPQAVAAHLTAVSAHPLPPALEKKLLNAFESYREVRIWYGVTVVLPPAKAAAAEKRPTLKEAALAHPAENVFVFPAEAFDRIEKELTALGIVHIPRPHEPKNAAAAFTAPTLTDTALPFDPTECVRPPLASPNDSIRRKTLSDALKAAHYRDPIEKELETKIRKKIILFPEQIGEHAKRTDSLVASGLDFARKLNLIKTALKDSSYLLELTLFSGGKKKTVPAVPVGLKRDGPRYTLLWRAPGREEIFSVEPEKIVSVRLLRSSLL